MTAVTRLPAEVTRRFGCDELHAVFLQHRADRGGVCSSVTVILPEAADQLPAALAKAHRLRARVVLICDTSDQAEAARVSAGRLMPDHIEISVARAIAGAWALHA